MRNTLIFLAVMAAMPIPLAADTWAPPVERDYHSSNRNFVANVTPAKKEVKGRLEVFRIENSNRIGLWDCTLGNEGAPQAVFLTEDGQYVATVNENSGRVHGGFGDYVVAFYGKTGLIKNYSLEQILHYTGPPNRLGSELSPLVGRSVSGRSWASMPMFFDGEESKLCFCVWLYHGKYWLAWDVVSGDEAKITERMKERWNEKGRQWALSESREPSMDRIALKFLAALKRPEDRKLIESLLSRGRFQTSDTCIFRPKDKDSPFIRYNCRSPDRELAERLLAEWDGKPAKDPEISGQKYYYLGVLNGILSLPRAPEVGDGRLNLFLFEPGKTEAYRRAPIPLHRLQADFSRASICFKYGQGPGADVPFRIAGITPGRYALKAVWDLAEPHTFGDKDIKGPPSPGDYESVNGPTITIKAGQVIENVEVDCTHEVSGQGG